MYMIVSLFHLEKKLNCVIYKWPDKQEMSYIKNYLTLYKAILCPDYYICLIKVVFSKVFYLALTNNANQIAFDYLEYVF